MSPGLSQWSAQMVEVCETMAESSVMHRSSASTKAGTGMEDSLSVPHTRLRDGGALVSRRGPAGVGVLKHTDGLKTKGTQWTAACYQH